ncbi:hypothetical protein CONPUDRAFT_118197 [Coniophora puteana RWD-64-598 SS2]|uniref:Cytochrome b561 domain-containing protein n=1 Tax=Coniophora puteana (strain RWD-64-598) TaxID=741705 RepID=A0A5M3N250_CONPW|nr:uncharacterized protein CONPUDRAFT_118197 [Coniophora puteana RWD-64-598 SS2]EIW85386.1 hypothetical protein CONPUDRAFT_118197 [Coniophora puteana RWD-64-598 SS2]
MSRSPNRRSPDPSASPDEHFELLPDEQPDNHPGLPTNHLDAGMGSDDIVRPEGRNGDYLAMLVATAAITTLVGLTWLILLGSGPFSLGLFAWHPFLQCLAIACFTYGIITLQPTSQPKTKVAGLQRHQTGMFLLGFPSILLGTAAIFFRKSLHGASHFTTWHGTFGIIAMVWLVGQILLGGASVWFDGMALGGGMRAKKVWKYHRLSGYVLFVLLLLTAFLGGSSSTWSVNNSPVIIRVLAYWIAPPVVIGALALRIRTSKMKLT